MSKIGSLLPHPVVMGSFIAALGASLLSRRDRNDIATRNNCFNTGLCLSQSYPIWSPYFSQRGFETLYNFNHTLLSASPPLRVLLGLVERPTPDPSLHVKCLDMDFDHPIGLAPGLSRTGDGLKGYLDLGFSFAECGSVTLYPESGTPPRRLFELDDVPSATTLPAQSNDEHQLFGVPRDDLLGKLSGFFSPYNTNSPNIFTLTNWLKSLLFPDRTALALSENQQQQQQLQLQPPILNSIKFTSFLNNMGNPNQGARQCAEALREFRETASNSHALCPIGVNISLNSSIDAKLEPQNYQDFLTVYNIVAPYTNFIVINVIESEAFAPIHPDRFDPASPHQPHISHTNNHHHLNDNDNIPLDPKAYVVNTSELFLQRLLRETGLTQSEFNNLQLTLPPSLNNLPAQAIHYQINPMYTQFVESLLQFRDSSRAFPHIHQQLNSSQSQDEKLMSYYQDKLNSLEIELDSSRVYAHHLLTTNLDRSFEENSTTRSSEQTFSMAPSMLADEINRTTDRITSVEHEIKRVHEEMESYHQVIAKNQIEYLKTIPVDPPTNRVVSKVRLLDQEEERLEVVSKILQAQNSSQDSEALAKYLEEFKNKREEVLEAERIAQNPLEDTFSKEIGNIAPFAQFHRINTDKIQGYRVYDRAKLTTFGSMEAIDLSRAWSRTQNRKNRPKVLFKLASDIEPRLAVLFSKFAVLHGVDGLIIGGGATNRNAIFQPSLFPSHQSVLNKTLSRPSITPLDHSLTNLATQFNFPPLSDLEQAEIDSTSPNGEIPIPNRFQPGYFSGPILSDQSTKLIATIYQHTNGRIPLIGTGGITSGRDVYDKIHAGASLVQLHSALYHDLTIVPKIRAELHDLISHEYQSHQAALDPDTRLQQQHLQNLKSTTRLLPTPPTSTTTPFTQSNPTDPHDFKSLPDIQNLKTLRQIDNDKWSLNRIVGVKSHEMSLYDIDPFVQCYNDFEALRLGIDILPTKGQHGRGSELQ